MTAIITADCIEAERNSRTRESSQEPAKLTQHAVTHELKVIKDFIPFVCSYNISHCYCFEGFYTG